MREVGTPNAYIVQRSTAHMFKELKKAIPKKLKKGTMIENINMRYKLFLK